MFFSYRKYCVVSLLLLCSGCAALNAGMGGNTRQQALAAADWGFAKAALSIAIEADPGMNQYDGQAHTLLLGVYQIADAATFRQLADDPVALAKQLVEGGNGQGLAQQGLLELRRYVVTPGQRTTLVLDRAQNARFIAVVAAYYTLSADTATRLFEVPLLVQSKGILSRTYQATAMPLHLRLVLGADGIVDAHQLADPATSASTAPESSLRQLEN